MVEGPTYVGCKLVRVRILNTHAQLEITKQQAGNDQDMHRIHLQQKVFRNNNPA